MKEILQGQDVSVAYEMSSSGALLRYLRSAIPDVVSSEYLEDVEPGSCRNGVRCEDVQKLSFPDDQFGLCTSTEVFEHVANDIQGFSEIHRVLRPGGTFVFTVPMNAIPITIERAVVVDGQIRYLLPAAYHGDRLRGAGKVLVFRDYGLDIIDRLRSSGFARAELREANSRYFGFGRTVVIASK